MIYKALMLLHKRNPDLCFLLQNVSIDIVDTAPTACIFWDKKAKKFKILIGIEFSKGFKVEDYAAIIEHELMHLIFRHIGDNTYTDRALANIAQDAVINDICEFLKPSERSKRHENLKSGVFLEDINTTHKKNFDVRRTTSKDIYDFLVSLSEQDKKDLTDQSFDEHFKDGIEDSPLPEILANSKPEFEKLIRGFGEKSLKESRKFLEAIKDKEIKENFLNDLKKFHCSIKSDDKRSTIKRPNRRTGIVFGVEKKKTKKALFILDVSGSMMKPATMDKMQCTFLSCVREGFEIDIIAGDTALTFDQKKVSKDFNFSSIEGGGGTVLSWIGDRGKGDDCVIVITDLEFHHDDIAHLPVSRTLILCTGAMKHNTFKTIGV